jgi:TfoX/Sxy family transcriptional regulator of competence genes
MAYDDDLADRIRGLLSERSAEVSERKMFGGIAFMVRDHMTVGVIGDELMVRVGKDAHEDAVAQPHARVMDFTGKPMPGMIYVAASGIADDTALGTWIDRGLAFTTTLPPKNT